MPEIKLKTKKKNSSLVRRDIEMYYRSKYYALFMNGYEFEGLDYQQQRFALSQFWEVGTINAFILEGSKPESINVDNKTEAPNGVLVLTPYAPFKYNIYNFATEVTPVRLRGATFIPQRPMKVNKECVIGFAHSSHMSVRSIVEFYVEKITDVEVTINMNLQTHKLPRLVVCSPEDKARVEAIMNDIEAGLPRLFLTASDIKSIQAVLNSGGEYIIDKLYTYKLNLEKELMTILGIDNVGIVKKERENVDETNANNEEIDNGGDCFLDEMKIWTKQVSEILAYPLKVKEKKPKVELFEYDSNDRREEGDEDEN